MRRVQTLAVRTALTTALALALCVGAVARADQTSPQAFDISAQSLGAALSEFARQSHAAILFTPEIVTEKKTEGVHGTLPPLDALKRLLIDSGLTFKTTPQGAILVQRVASSGRGTEGEGNQGIIRLAQAEGPTQNSAESTAKPVSSGPTKNSDTTSESYSSSEEVAVDIPQILVKGSRSLDADIKRTRDDIQPYVVFDHDAIERSQAANIEDFLKSKLPMNAAQTSTIQQAGAGGAIALNSGTINLRGLGTNQTLILVDGRRLAGVASTGDSGQPNINGISTAAIDRIEILPSTAGAIYGGSATGGVINIILRHDYSGFEVKANYGNSFKADAGGLQLSGSGGVSLQEGRTPLTFFASYQESDPLLVTDRDFAQRARFLQFSNNPSAFTGGFRPPSGAGPNVCVAEGGACGTTPLVLKGGSDIGAAFTSLPSNLSGSGGQIGADFAADAGKYNLEIPNLKEDILRKTSVESSSFDLRHDFGSGITAYLNAYADRQKMSASQAVGGASGTILSATDVNNPFQQDVYVTYQPPTLAYPAETTLDNLRFSGGLIAQLPADWVAALDYGWNRSRNTSDFTSNAIDSEGYELLTAGALRGEKGSQIDVLSHLRPGFDQSDGPSEAILNDSTLRISGPVVQLPGGSAVVSASIERRRERAPNALLENLNAPLPVTLIPSRSQSINSGYLEFRVPIISARNSLPLVHELELQASLRRDKYETVSTLDTPTATTRDGPFLPASYSTSNVTSTDHTIGLRFVPVNGMVLRASIATGFLPPSLLQISSGINNAFPAFILPFLGVTGDPRRGGTPITGDSDGNVTLIGGGSPALRPELSKSWSAGVVLTPTALDGFRLSVDFTSIEKTNEIVSLISPEFFIGHEADYPGRIIRSQNLPDDTPGWAGPITSIDDSAINLASTTVRAYDVQLDYEFKSVGFGRFRPFLIATIADRFERKILPDTPSFDSVGYSDFGAPLRWRGNLGLDWEYKNLAIEWSAQYFDSYSIKYADQSLAYQNPTLVLNQGSSKIPSQMYQDVLFRYRFSGPRAGTRSALAGTEVSVGIQNIFNASPPILATQAQEIEGGYSTYGDPRLRRFTVAIRKEFGQRE